MKKFSILISIVMILFVFTPNVNAKQKGTSTASNLYKQTTTINVSVDVNNVPIFVHSVYIMVDNTENGNVEYYSLPYNGDYYTSFEITGRGAGVIIPTIVAYSVNGNVSFTVTPYNGQWPTQNSSPIILGVSLY